MYSYRVSFPAPGETPEVPKPLKPIFIESEVPYELGSRIEHSGRQWVVTLAPFEQTTLGPYVDLEVWPADA